MNKIKKFTLSIYGKRIVITYETVIKFDNSKSIIKKLLYVTFILSLLSVISYREKHIYKLFINYNTYKYCTK